LWPPATARVPMPRPMLPAPTIVTLIPTLLLASSNECCPVNSAETTLPALRDTRLEALCPYLDQLLSPLPDRGIPLYDLDASVGRPRRNASSTTRRNVRYIARSSGAGVLQQASQHAPHGRAVIDQQDPRHLGGPLGCDRSAIEDGFRPAGRPWPGSTRTGRRSRSWMRTTRSRTRPTAGEQTRAGVACPVSLARLYWGCQQLTSRVLLIESTLTPSTRASPDARSGRACRPSWNARLRPTDRTR
jgi:hypothetical protein